MNMPLDPTFIWQDLSQAQRRQLQEHVTRFRSQPGQPFYRPHDRGEVLFWLAEGQVRLYRLAEEGSPQGVAILEGPALFGEMGLLGQTMEGCYATVQAPCEVMALSRQDVEWVILHYPAVAVRLLQAVGRMKGG